MTWIGWRGCLLVALVLAWSGAVLGQDQQETSRERRTGWANTTDLSFVVTEGNSSTETFGLKNLTERTWERSVLTLRLEGLMSNTADDRYRRADPGFTWVPGETPTGVTSSLIEPAAEPDAEKYLVETRFERTISKPRLLGSTTGRATWNIGASWDRDRDAGILRRLVAFAGLGHIWRDREDFRFRTGYALSGTDRKEETIDPEKEQQFYGFRLTSHFLDEWGQQTTFTTDFKFNLNLEDTSDYSSDLTSAIAVSMSTHLDLKVSLQWLFNSEPALEDIDFIARVELIDPDGTPGTGDEYFQTVSDGGSEVALGEVQERKKELDVVFRTSLAIKF